MEFRATREFREARAKFAGTVAAVVEACRRMRERDAAAMQRLYAPRDLAAAAALARDYPEEFLPPRLGEPWPTGRPRR